MSSDSPVSVPTDSLLGATVGTAAGYMGLGGAFRGAAGGAVVGHNKGLVPKLPSVGEAAGAAAGYLGLGGAAAGFGLGHQAQKTYDAMTAIPRTQAPPAPPSLGAAAMVGVNSELAHEQRMAAASTILTSGAGLMDEPTTASRVLLGS